MPPFHPQCIKTIWCNKMNADIKTVVMVTRIMETTEEEAGEEDIMAPEDTIVMSLSSSTLEEEVIMEASGAIGEVNMEDSGAMEEIMEIHRETGINISNRGIIIQTMEVVMVIRQTIEEEIIDGLEFISKR